MGLYILIIYTGKTLLKRKVMKSQKFGVVLAYMWSIHNLFTHFTFSSFSGGDIHDDGGGGEPVPVRGEQEALHVHQAPQLEQWGGRVAVDAEHSLATTFS